MNPARYSRQILLPQIGRDGQEILHDSHALLLGVGGLGSAAALYLAAAGLGRLTLVDGDRVENSNLQRQIAHGEDGIGEFKARSAQQRILALKSEVQVAAITRRADAKALEGLIASADVVLDCSDNFPTRYAVNAACVAQQRPLVSGAAVRLEGQLAVFRPGRPDSPCYHCLYADDGSQGEACEDAGVLGPVVGVIGSLQATEAIKLLLGLDSAACGRLTLYDAACGSWRTLTIPPDPACPVCRKRV